MEISELQEGMHVSCPADRGTQAYRGKVEHVGNDTCVNHQGIEYVW